ncbi:hypothetical protein OV203_17375 [Nannocystis sp. ILAH1]|uniref:hypothetical protein n=1 Tax=unclassified Nannocystis TaxID=2627009 RepID=UPI00226D7F93|nr:MULTISPECIES: hypothetical protein [unclassified Nannocystis]MCY0988912.1 hypothetical protein [Nannocystis sp. ILAH1]MCY1072662.1 hypothetical protein [Nannocystis sp. RBIL2]
MAHQWCVSACLTAALAIGCGNDSDPLDTLTTNPTASAPVSGSGPNPSGNPSDTSTTSDDTGGPATEGPPTTDPTSTTTGDPTGGPAANRVPCNRYIECVAVTNPGGLLDAQEDFGEASSCWTGTPADAELCITACKAGLAQGHELAPEEPACFECASDDECDVGGGEACIDGNCRVPGPGAAVQPIWNTYCIECHVQGGSASGWFVLTEDLAYDSIVNQPSLEVPLLRVAPGDHESSYLWHKVNGTHVDVGGNGVRMPAEAAPLPQDVIDEIAAWIDEGALP